jgi:hypothetical protein
MDGQELQLDKNKSAHKLKGLPHIYWLNLDADTHRKDYMENQFRYWEIENHTRISGFDGREDDVSSHLKGRIPDNVSQAELGCCMSHLKAIKHFYEETDDDYCLILEDDVNFDIVRYWNFTWQEFFGLIPYDWDCVQMTTICTGDIHVKLHLFLYNLELGSAIHTEHLGIFHKGPHDALLNWWQQAGAGIDLKDHMNYDPYLGRVVENSAAKAAQQAENPPS